MTLKAEFIIWSPFSDGKDSFAMELIRLVVVLVASFVGGYGFSEIKNRKRQKHNNGN
jgi:hypothetical protein